MTIVLGGAGRDDQLDLAAAAALEADIEREDDVVAAGLAFKVTADNLIASGAGTAISLVSSASACRRGPAA